MTVSGNEKWFVKSHLVMRMIADEMQYQEKRVETVRSTRNTGLWTGA